MEGSETFARRCSGTASLAAPSLRVTAGEGAGAAGESRSASRRWRHQAGTMASTPRAQPAANTTSTTITIGACHSTPKNQRTLAGC